MALKDTINEMEKILSAITEDLIKSLKGNQAACQRIRVNTIHFEKISKKYRKESLCPLKKTVKASSKKKKK